MTKRRKAGQKAPIYDPEKDRGLYTIKLYHGGDMVDEPYRHYVNGVVDYFDFVDVDEFGVMELRSMVEELGYDKNRCVFWHTYGHTLHMGARLLNTEAKVYRILKNYPQQKEHEIYVFKFEVPDVEDVDEWELMVDNVVTLDVESFNKEVP